MYKKSPHFREGFVNITGLKLSYSLLTTLRLTPSVFTT